MFFKEAGKIGNIAESQIVGDLAYRHAGILQATFGFEHQPLMQNAYALQCGNSRHNCSGNLRKARFDARILPGEDVRDSGSQSAGQKGVLRYARRARVSFGG